MLFHVDLDLEFVLLKSVFKQNTVVKWFQAQYSTVLLVVSISMWSWDYPEAVCSSDPISEEASLTDRNTVRGDFSFITQIM